MTIDQIDRLNYYQRQYLGAADFEAEQAYHRDMRRRHNLAHHTWGIVTGLELMEVEREDQNSGVEVYVMPGMAIDGYGREILVLEPYKLDPSLFSSLTEADYLEAYITYCQKETQRPASGYELCEAEKHLNRVRETFRIVIEPGLVTDDGLEVAGRKADPSTAKVVGQSEPTLTIPLDGSVPHQEFPDEDERPRWLVRLGSVRWSGSGSTGLTSAGAAYLSEGREYVGNVTAAVLAPDAKLRIGDRGTESPMKAGDSGVAVTVEGIVEVEGTLEVDGLLTANGNVYAKKKVGIGTATPDVSLHVSGSADATLKKGSGLVVVGNTDGKSLVLDGNEIIARDQEAKSTLHLQAEGGQLSVHANKPGTKFVVTDKGDVGIGTTGPDTRLQIAGGSDAKLANGTGFLVIGGVGGANLVLDQDEIMARNAGANSPLHLQAQGGMLTVHNSKAGTKVVVTDAGNVGVGTTAPNVKLHVVGGTAASLAKGTGAFVIGDVNGKNVAMDINGMMCRNNAGKSPLHLQANGGMLKVHHHNAGTEFVVKDNGQVGIGTSSPSVMLHVRGGGDADLTDASGFVVIGNVDGDNLVMDSNEIMARSNGARAGLHLQANGGMLKLHHWRPGTEFVVTDSGTVAIKKNSPEAPYVLDVNGHARATGFWWSSDVRLKRDVKPLGSVLERVGMLRGVEFEWDVDQVAEGASALGKRIGVIAQEVEEVFPELVKTAGDGIKAVSYSDLVAVLLQAVKELGSEIAALEKRVEALEKPARA
jgi:hypothetical protein